jgi:hypothetical protein
VFELILRVLRLLFTLIAVGAIAFTLGQIFSHWQQLPPSVPSNISSDGSAHGSMPTWSLLIAPIVEAVVTIALLSGLAQWGRYRGRYPLTELGWAAMWLAIACGFSLAAMAEWMQIDAALHPLALHPMPWYTYALIAGIVSGAVITTVDSGRRPDENAG